VTKQEFFEWKQHPVTEQVFRQIAERITQIKEELMAQVAHVSQLELAEKAGAGKAFQHILDIDYEES
jgi:hypothetical protein